MPLSDVKCRNARAKERPYKIADSNSLYLLVGKNGSRLCPENHTQQNCAPADAAPLKPTQAAQGSWRNNEEKDEGLQARCNAPQC
jgi:hypothetical protein